MILEILNALKSFVENQTGKTVIIEPTSPIDLGQSAIFYENTEIQDVVEPGTYRNLSTFSIAIVDTLENCVSAVNSILQNFSQNILGNGTVSWIRKVEKQAKEETEQYFVFFIFIEVAHYGLP